MTPKQAQKLTKTQFKRYFGIERETYQHMLKTLQEAYTKQHKKVVAKPK